MQRPMLWRMLVWNTSRSDLRQHQHMRFWRVVTERPPELIANTCRPTPPGSPAYGPVSRAAGLVKVGPVRPAVRPLQRRSGAFRLRCGRGASVPAASARDQRSGSGSVRFLNSTTLVFAAGGCSRPMCCMTPSIHRSACSRNAWASAGDIGHSGAAGVCRLDLRGFFGLLIGTSGGFGNDSGSCLHRWVWGRVGCGCCGSRCRSA